MNKKGLETRWITPITTGRSPTPRYQHTMNFYDGYFPLLIIYGGRNDNLKNIEDSILHELNVLNLENLTWCQVSTYGISPNPRCAHTAGIIDSSLFIFGGYNFNEYLNGNISLLELDEGKGKFKEREDIEEKKLKKNVSSSDTNNIPFDVIF